MITSILSYTVTNKAKLESQGFIPNPNHWCQGWYFCSICKEYAQHYAMSKYPERKTIELCKNCDSAKILES